MRRKTTVNVRLTVRPPIPSVSGTIRDAVCRALKSCIGQLIYCTEPTSNKWKTEKRKSIKTDMLRSIGKQSGESVESVLKKKRKATVGRICRKGR